MTLQEADLVPRYQLARRIAHSAGQLTLRYFRQDLQVDRKSDDSPVTVADREAEKLLRQQISAAFPHDGILGEEFPETPGTSGFRWILDPIDGTKSFICGVPLYGTLVAVECVGDSEFAGDSVIGVIYLPALREGVHAASGHGAWYQMADGEPEPALVSQRSRLADGVLLTSQVDSFADRGAADAYRQLEQAAWITRTWGDCYGHLLVATGRAEVMIDPVMCLWDCAPLQPILEEAGGTLTDWQGKATIHAGEAIATNDLLLPEVLAVTRQFPRPPTP
jgi:histidinol phosphatase-like enzyme (inositol monophosphatase family)